MDARLDEAEDALVPLDTFFIGQTTGAGVARDVFGRIVRRFRVDTRGAREGAYGAMVLDETFSYDDGEVEALRWAIMAGGPRRYVLAEAQAGAGIVAQSHDADLTFAYRRPFGALRGVRTPRFAVRMTLMSPSTMLKSVRVTLLGIPVASLTAVHQRRG